MKSYVTTYNGLFSLRAGGGPVVERIEIPIIQRDYAQGRESLVVERIRQNFLDAIHAALTNGSPISLDFVYGEVVDGTFRPLDGQQRLTTLFLLHWYLAWRAERIEQEQGWKQFQYATRPSSARFCKCLVEMKPPSGANLREWFEDQHWFLHTWQHDPSIQAMLVMIESIHLRFAEADCIASWDRLVDDVQPAISFHLLPVDQMGLSEDLYIKMNSRGKPLTPFENFKARFEQVLDHSCPDRVEEFAGKVDGAWADLLWPHRGEDDLVDDEFLRYFLFVTEVCAWQGGEQPSDDLQALAEEVYGPDNENAGVHLDFLIRAFDTWIEADTDAVFSELFALTPAPFDAEVGTRVVLFGRQGNSINLFAECCRAHVQRSWQRTLLLYAVLLHRLHDTAAFPRRLRMLRNLIEASSNELRAERMPALLADVRRLIVEGALNDISSFNQAQLIDEQLKVEFLSEFPELERYVFHLEDHPLLRGSLAVFELDAAVFERRSRAFHDMFSMPDLLPTIAGALLAAGNYSQQINHRFLQLGSGTETSQWREDILTGSSRANLSNVRGPLGKLLDVTSAREGDLRTALESFSRCWLESKGAETGLDWRWYFVRYPEMRAGRSGIYASPTGAFGYNICMLDKRAMSSYYRDPYLSAIWAESGVSDSAVEGSVAQHWGGGPWFSGYETEARWMRLRTSGAGIQCVQDGLQLGAPEEPAHADLFVRVCEMHAIGPDLRLRIPQISPGRRDKVDRVQVGAALLRDLVGAGL